jgi:CoA-transferase family III
MPQRSACPSRPMYALSASGLRCISEMSPVEGTSFEASLFEALAEWVSQPTLFTAAAGRQPGRFGAQCPTIAPYGPYQAHDGHVFLIAIQNEPEWTRFWHFGVDPHNGTDSRHVGVLVLSSGRRVIGCHWRTTRRPERRIRQWRRVVS